MREQKFHINKAGDVKECNANERKCRFGGYVDHFTDHGEALKAAEQRSKEESGDEFGTVTRRIAEVEKVAGIFVDPELKKRIVKLASRKEMTPEQFQEIGAVFEQEFEKQLPFNPWDHELSEEEFDAIKKMNRELYSALVDNGGDMPVKATGPLSDELNNAIKILPNHVKAKIPELNTVFLNSNTIKRWGQYRHLKDFYTQEPKDGSYYLGKEEMASAQDDVLLPGHNGTLENFEKEDFASEVYMKKNGGKKVETFWVGKKPKSQGYKKVANYSKILVNGEMVRINKPLYKVFSTKYQLKSEIAVTQDVPKESLAMERILLHEYCHAVQYSDDFNVNGYELEMFDTVASEKRIKSKVWGSRYTGFPHRYMGITRNYELFTVASEGLFSPDEDDRNFFYGTQQGKNAKPVRQWITGLWLSLANTHIPSNQPTLEEIINRTKI